MTASYNYLVSSGTVTVDTADLLSTVQGEYLAALGQGMSVDSSTPQGTLISGETLTRTKTMKNNADVANTINPDLSYGVFLDAICSFLGISRGTNTSTIGTGVVLSGTPLTTTITANSRVKTQNGDIFFVAADVPIPATGSAMATLYSQSFGNVALPVGNLTIVDGIVGWGSAVVTTATTVTPGTTAYTDPQLKIKRKQQLAKQGRGHIAAIRANVIGAPGVIDCNVVENNTGTVTTVNGVPFTLPNAVWVCVAGMTSANKQAIANAAYLAHGGGCPWDYGNASGTPVDAPNGTPAADPSTGMPYNNKLTQAVLHDAYVQITVKQGTNTSSIESAIPQAMVTYASGLEDSEDGLLLGTGVSSLEMAGAAIRQLPGIYVKNCLVAVVPAGSPAPPQSAYVVEVVMNPWDMAQLSLSSVQVTVVT